MQFHLSFFVCPRTKFIYAMYCSMPDIAVAHFLPSGKCVHSHLCMLTPDRLSRTFPDMLEMCVYTCCAHLHRFKHTFPDMLEMCLCTCVCSHGPPYPHISRNVRLTRSTSPAHFQHLWNCAAYMVRLTRTFPASLEMCSLHGPSHPHISSISGNVRFTWSA